ncbi:ATP-binding cassette domain-containing protein [Pseudoalteromonas sp. DL2-H2.2]|uniref:ABC transporter ATP-binding protein n=1 Tax=Pseudoalteromonas sp. DL2-H2.2 TaxID=2908889 RepID=UPI001F29CA83|nr:ATP-binding cassette domain-containing protein [Pseudoalteromonas sp. DL2-H2.2]MCF2910561.1 ATP-binding cassette domain-containing protein [Pseudoalteromonas sp. DL2-H2.2]
MIEIKHLSKVYLHDPVFSDYSATLAEQKLCIEAPNGQGKSTLFRIIAGLDDAFHGAVLFDGQPQPAAQQVVALASDSIPYPEFLTARQLLQLTVKSWACPWPELMIAQLGFEPFLDTRYGALSSGNQKKCQLINAIMRNTPYLVLDEPSAALDHASLDVLLGWLKHHPAQVIISCHEPLAFIDIGFATQPLFG